MAHTTLSTSCPGCGRLFVPGYPVTPLADGGGRCLCCFCFESWTLNPKTWEGAD